MSTAEAIAESVDYESQALDKLYEVVNGEVVEQPPMGAYAQLVALHLYDSLQPFVGQMGLGRAFLETLFLLNRDPRLERRPDVSFASRERLHGKRPPYRGAYELVPNLAVEVSSPTNTGVDIDAKVLEYFEAGVQLVWVLYPETRQIYIYDSPTDVRIFGDQAVVDGGQVLPGFSWRLSDALSAVDEMG